MASILDLYNKMIKAKQHYKYITTFHNFEIFFKLKQELFKNLDNIILDENNWIINDDKLIKCIRCNYFIRCNDINLLKYKKLVHQEFNCKQ